MSRQGPAAVAAAAVHSGTESSDYETTDDEDEVQEPYLLTEEQEEQVLDFYKLPSMRPTTWNASLPNSDAGVVVTANGVVSAMVAEDEDDEDEDDEIMDESLAAADAAGMLTAQAHSQDKFVDLLDLATPAGRAAWHLAAATDPTVVPTFENFDPRRYLAVLYKDARFNSLTRGLNTLEDRIAHSKAGLSSLVRDNLDKFVSAKDTVDDLYAIMMKNKLAGKAEGTAPLRQSIGDLHAQSQILFLPMIERRRRAEQLRATLSYLEQYKFMFNLPSSLRQSLSKRNYEAALRDYRKGKQYQDIDPEVYKHIWAQVTKIMAELRSQLVALLKDPLASMDVHMQLIDLVNETDAADKAAQPGWVFTKALVDYIQNTISDIVKPKAAKNSGVNRKSKVTRRRRQTISRQKSDDPLERKNLPLLSRAALERILVEQNCSIFEAEDLHEDPAIREGIVVFREKLALVQRLSAFIVGVAGNLVKTIGNFSSGAYAKKVGVATQGAKPSMQMVDQANAMLRDALLSYYTNLAEVLFSGWDDTPCGPLVYCYYYGRAELYISYVTDYYVKLGVSADLRQQVHREADNVRSNMIKQICSAFTRVSTRFIVYEDWSRDPEADNVSSLPRLYFTYAKTVICTFRDLLGSVSHSSSLRLALCDTIQEELQRALLAFCDVLHDIGTLPWAAVQRQIAEAHGRATPAASPSASSLHAEPDTSGRRSAAGSWLSAAQRADVGGDDDGPRLQTRSGAFMAVSAHGPRLLAVANNVRLLRETLLGSIGAEAEPLLERGGAATLVDAPRRVLGHLVTLLLEQYIWRKGRPLDKLVEAGLLRDDVAWAENDNKPTRLRSYVHTLLLELVLVHAELRDCSPKLLPTVIGDLHCLVARSFNSRVAFIASFAPAPAACLLAEIGFVRRVLAGSETEKSGKLWDRTTLAIKAATQGGGGRSADVEKTIKEALEATSVQFGCFAAAK